MTTNEVFRPSRRTVLAALTVGGVLAATRTAAASGLIPPGLLPGGELDRYVAGLAADDRFSGTVLLAHHSRPVLVRSYGMADKELHLPNRPGTVFAVASITKLFTKVAIRQLVQQGEVAGDATLGTYLDGFPPEIAGTVTVDQLLTHTSGMGDFHDDEGFAEESRGWDSADEVMAGIMRYVRRGTLSFPPRYSNSGYVTLGAIVAAVSGRSYYDYIREHVFRPARMSSSDFCTKPQWRDDRRLARPYTLLPSGERVDAIDNHLFIGTPAGGAFSTADDLARFTRIHLPGQAVNAHGGNPGGGVCADLDAYPESGWVTAVLSNYENATQEIDALARQLITGKP